MALVPVSVVAAAYPAVRTLRASTWTAPEVDEEPWTMPFRTWDVPHAPRPLDAISAYREPFAPPPLLLDAYA
ncbi:MAG: hypothetical protein JOZ56_11455 [Actinobacteria bacterium]|nr:hypothetical protein [Actinomycetota bacterium]